ncbi:hypothetical protein [Bacillus cereus]|uniref:Uncharacterized protein n=1 Tax=Bacillus cereus HuA3-9 TaxID=1053205 RepID=R8CIB1_BACCE|nr:hypothetical protein [Bacillus cereus]EOO11354.1 hypothetical protein IGA_05617 [Bacillus cereus HuA3-9]
MPVVAGFILIGVVLVIIAMILGKLGILDKVEKASEKAKNTLKKEEKKESI